MAANADKQRKNSGKRVVGIPFPKGVSGNPLGRPKKKTAMEEVRELLMADGASPSQTDVARKYIELMMKGSFSHLKEYIDRQEGKVPDRIADADGGKLGQHDISKLTLEELIVLRNLQRKSAVGQPDAGDLPQKS